MYIKLSDNQYFLIIKKLNLFPEIKPNTINMLEQIFNAILLQRTDNIEAGLNTILELEYFCKPYLNNSYIDLLNKISQVLNENNIYIVRGEQVRVAYARYGYKDKCYWDVGKQIPMNIEFSLEKKLKYDGKNITLEDTYSHWLNKIIMERERTTSHNPNDKFINSQVFQKVQDLHWEIEHVIQNETIKYIDQYRKKLIEQK